MSTTTAPKKSRAKVLNGTIPSTSGGLRKSDLKRNKKGRIVSRVKSDAAKRNVSGQLKLWQKAVSQTYKKPAYRGTFQKLKVGNVFYKHVCSAYKKLLQDKYGKTHIIEKKAGTTRCKYILVKRRA
jgi:hypothetical protein